MTRAAVAGLLVGIAGCTASGLRQTPLNDRLVGDLLAYEFADERGEADAGRPPEIGPALSGGGTRAAAFAMGVLRGLYEQGILQKTEVVSSVSGGGYAAYFYFSKLLAFDEGYLGEDGNDRGLGVIFDDCIPLRYARLCNDGPGSRCGLGLDSTARVCTTLAHTVDDPCDPYRFQGHVRGFVNVLSDRPSFSKAPNYCAATLSGGAETAAESVLTLPWHATANVRRCRWNWLAI